MGKTTDQQELLNHIWHVLHEKNHDSRKAADEARKHRIEENPKSEMALELAAMEFVTAGAAAKDSKTYQQAHPLFVQAAQVALETFPFSDVQDEARKRGNDWDKVYGDQSAQMTMLRNYFHLIRRLEQVIATEHFQAYSHSLWEMLLRLSNEFQDDVSVIMLHIEHDTYPHATQAFDKFLAMVDQAESSSQPDSSRIITVASRMMNRALQESDYDTTLKAFTVALNALRNDPEKLTHFARQIASNVRADKNIQEKRKLNSWQKEAATTDLDVLTQLLQLKFFGLGNDRVEHLDEV